MKLLARRLVLIAMALSIVLPFLVPSQVLAYNAAERKSLMQKDIIFVDNDVCASGGGGNGVEVTGISAFLSGDPLTTGYPNITNPDLFAAAMEKFIRARSPHSPWLAISGLGQRLASEGQARGVNPMLIIVIGNQESNLGTSAVATSNKNSFGNKGSGPHGYRTWPSFEASLFGNDSFTQSVKGRLSGEHASYKDVKNMYEYLSVHVSGQIIYPGDSTTVHDPLMNQDVNADGVVTYFKNAEKWIGEMTGQTITGIPVRGSGGESTCPLEGEGGAGGTVNPEGFAWPVADGKKHDYADAPCRRRACHWNNTPAFDLYYGPTGNMDGKAVYAISDGTISRLDTYHVTGCYSIQFKSTKDNFYYWYGHMQSPSVKQGQSVKAGQQIGQVARNALGSDCRGGRDHLHIDRGCTRGGVPQPGGSTNCRDYNFVPFLDKMWEGLPA